MGGQHCRQVGEVAWVLWVGTCRWIRRSAIMLLAVSMDAKWLHGWIALPRMVADTVVDSLAGRADVVCKEWELLNDERVDFGFTPFDVL